MNNPPYANEKPSPEELALRTLPISEIIKSKPGEPMLNATE
jgi:hypothetical protein